MPFERYEVKPGGSYTGFTGINDGKGCFIRFIILIVVVTAIVIFCQHVNFAS